MNPINFEKTILEVRKIAKRNTRDKSKKQFDYELFEYPFLEYIKEKKIGSDIMFQIASEFMQSPDNFDRDMAIFIIRFNIIDKEAISDFLKRYLAILNEEQANIALSLIEKHKLENLYYPVIHHLKKKSFYDSESLKNRIIYTGILFNKEEGYIAFHKVLERDLLNPRTETELSIGNILFLCIIDKSYDKIQNIFQRYSNRKTKKLMTEQLFIAANRWNANMSVRLILKKTIVFACLKNILSLAKTKQIEIQTNMTEERTKTERFREQTKGKMKRK
ncbi:hypothetical protein [Leptospira santarosai]|uniref:hypothetical protein n=1 Tax=Leptospira santarosai TaxID=28183 RepID=UPI0002BF4F98|nr:hypothetical protein [Leptospira santarosai]EMJ49716.1 hypothetical protein LEP1GSC169_0851 [Leptospira santarosai str. HAI1349]EMP79660.1 hypothetical protein LEP1GSC162_3452 [Leptospira santarosai str. CBC1531]